MQHSTQHSTAPNSAPDSAGSAVKTVVVVGGGNAGWLTAGRIAAEHRLTLQQQLQQQPPQQPHHQPQQALRVILIEAPGIPPIGVGEGTWPTMRSTLLALGIRETDFINACDVSFKQGAKFARWVDGSAEDFYYHPLVLPQGFGKTDMAGFWQHGSQQQAFQQKNGQQQAGQPQTSQQEIKGWDWSSFANDLSYQPAVCEASKAPKTIRHPEYAALANYAYHLDSGKFGVFLQKHCIEQLGVEHIVDEVVAVHSQPCGDIAAVETKQHGVIHGDLFVDCSGFSALLIGKHYQVPFVSCSDVLFIDRALAVQVPYDSPDAEIASHTISTAQDAGWIWDIGLQHRRGVGYVYASRYCSDDEARATLRQYVGPALDALQVRQININSGHRAHFWHRNCVAVGLAAGFLEPLEASALVLVELSAQFIATQLPANRQVMDIVARRFNDTFLYRWQRIIDFLKLHYVLTRRPEPFWQDNCKADTIPASLQDLLLLWQHRAPGDLDFTSNNEVFPAASYQYVLYGMGFRGQTNARAYAPADWDMALSQLEHNRKLTAQALATLPSHRELLNKIRQFGLSPV